MIPFRTFGNINGKRHVSTTFIIEHTEWTSEDNDDLKALIGFPKFSSLKKLLHKRLNTRTEELINGKDTRDRIDEIKDLLLELQNYAGI